MKKCTMILLYITVSVTFVVAPSVSLAVSNEASESSAVRKGMTWGRIADPPMAIEGVGCSGCNPYQGDTSCSERLPILCINTEGEPRPNYEVVPHGGCMSDEYYRGWAGGHIGLTAPVPGTNLTSLASANALCASTFGAGYRMAEFHDGKYVTGMDIDTYYGNTWPSSARSGGWNFYAYGDIDDSARFWTHINDQRANCWNSLNDKGMTWSKIDDPPTAIEGVGCSGCNPYQGDTTCSSRLPILCINPEGEPRENYEVMPHGGCMSDEYYRGWSGGHIGLTAPVPGTNLTSLASANALCASTFGAGYRMAEFHDGEYLPNMDIDMYFGNTWPAAVSVGGWNFYGYGDVSSASRFWTYIDDQSANCWDSVLSGP